jgi:hypothetical protein
MVDIQTPMRKRTAPYVPASTLSQFFDHIRYVQTPKKIDSNLVMDYGTSKSHAFALISTLKFLGLTDDRGIPTPIFRSLQTGGDEFKTTLNEVVKKAYSDLFERLDVTRDGRDKIINFFARNYSPATADRATALFLDLCGEAGIETTAQPRHKEPRKLSEPKQPKVGEQKQPPLNNDEGKKPKQSGDNTNSQVLPKGDIGEQITSFPGVTIRVDSKDLVSMNPEQIKALFEGLGKITKQDKE